MFSFFRKKSAGKPGALPESPEARRSFPSSTPAVARTRTNYDVTDENANAQKHVVNLLIPNTDYVKPTVVGGLFHNIMAGKKRKNKRNTITRAQSCREISPQKDMQSNQLEAYKQSEIARSADDVRPNENTPVDETPPDAADFVKALVLQKYANKSPETKRNHVSRVYVSDEPNIDEKRHAETLLREIARSIDCTIDQINAERGLMGADSSKDKPRVQGRNERVINNEPLYETIDETRDTSMTALKNDLRGELDKLLQEQNAQNEQAVRQEEEIKEEIKEETEVSETVLKKKSNLKPPRSDGEGCSDDDRSDCGKKRITFSKHIVFDDGDQQTDEEVDSSFESLSTSEEESVEEEEEDIPDNDENLGGVVVSRSESERTVIENVNEENIDTGQTDSGIRITVEHIDDKLPRISSDNSDSGFLEISEITNGSSEDLSEVKTGLVSESESELESEVTESETEEEIEEVIEEEVDEEVEIEEIEEEEEEEVSTTESDDQKSLVSQESKFQNQVAALTELADTRCGEAERARDTISQFRKEIEERDAEIERLKTSLASAYKESELIRQRHRSLQDELDCTRSYSAELSHQLTDSDNDTIRQLRSELESVLTRATELESRVQALERDKERLEQEMRLQEQRAAEALSAAESNTTRWRLAHEAARSQAAARAERMLADCEWKMRELEQRAREADKQRGDLEQTMKQTRSEKCQPCAAHMAELTQLRGQVAEQQRSVQALTLQLQRVETREEALKLEVHRLKDLLDKQCRICKDKEDRHAQTLERLQQQHTKALETTKAEMTASAASSRALLERTHAERTKLAITQLRADAERDSKNADRKLREVTTKFENLKELLATKEAHFSSAIAEANSKADWELLQLRHLLDKSDITYANNMEQAKQRYAEETESLIEEWSEKLKAAEEESETALEEARKLLEVTRRKLIAEKNDEIAKLKDQHRREMEDQWEQFMLDKETCLSRMKLECRQEGEEERVKREKELMEELAELRALIQSKTTDLDTLAEKAASCGRTLAVTEQELREALSRERELRERRSEDATKIKQAERAGRDQIDHLTRKCACLRKLFDDMRTKLATRERAAEEASRAKDKELHHLRAEVARLTKLLVESGVSAPRLGARTRADGCETLQDAESFLAKTEPPACDAQPTPPRRKGGTRTPEVLRKRPTLPELPALPPEATRVTDTQQHGRQRSKSVDLPAVQVPTRINYFQDKSK